MAGAGQESCGYHGEDQDGNPIYDYGCSDCQLPDNHLDPDEIN